MIKLPKKMIAGLIILLVGMGAGGVFLLGSGRERLENLMTKRILQKQGVNEDAWRAKLKERRGSSGPEIKAIIADDGGFKSVGVVAAVEDDHFFLLTEEETIRIDFDQNTVFRKKQEPGCASGNCSPISAPAGGKAWVMVQAPAEEVLIKGDLVHVKMEKKADGTFLASLVIKRQGGYLP